MTVVPADVLDFWFNEAGPALWFAVDPEFDRRVRTRFLSAWEQAVQGALEVWDDTVEGAFAHVIMLDQFPRNMFRGDERAFSTDALAHRVAERALAKGFDLEVPTAARHFFYLPWMHSETMADQDRSVALIGERCGTDHYAYPYALQHRATIARFGRFPARNVAVGRDSTPEEIAYLNELASQPNVRPPTL